MSKMLFIGRYTAHLELLDLPPEVLKTILLSLRNRSIPPTLLLFNASQHYFPVVEFGVKGRFSAKAPASESVLASLQANASALSRVRQAFKAEEDTRFQVAADYLMNVMQDVIAVDLESDFANCDTTSLHGLLSTFPGLRSIRLGYHFTREQSWSVETVQMLNGLPQLTCIEMGCCPSLEAVRLLSGAQAQCSGPMLFKLDLGTTDEDGGVFQGFLDDFEQIVATLASGGCHILKYLRDLSLPCPAAALHVLSSLTALQQLSALHVRTWGTGSLKGLNHLTLLESLRVEVLDWNSTKPTLKDLTPLTALARLTFLSLACGCAGLVKPHRKKHSVLSRLSSLRELHIYADVPFVKPSHQLPVQFRVLQWATALERLHLRVLGQNWLLMSKLREAIPSLSRLTQVRFRNDSCVSMPGVAFYRLMCLFTAGPPIQELMLDIDHNPCGLGDEFEEPCAAAYKVNVASGAEWCRRYLPRLESLSIGTSECLPISAPNCVQLLQGVPSSQLTALRLTVASTSDLLLEEIARFSSLQELCLTTDSIRVDHRLFDVLGAMTRLSKLVVSLPTKVMVSLPGDQSSLLDLEEVMAEIDRRATILKAALMEASEPLGHVPEVLVLVGGYAVGL